MLKFITTGYSYNYLDQYKRAINDYTRAIELDPEDAMAYNNRGIAYADLGQYKQAIRDYDRAIELNPEYAAAYNNRGNAYLMLNIIHAGCSDLKTACKLGDCKGLEIVRKKGFCLMP
jgi:tetratricopeptide (TPR) repeat protein